MTITVGVSVFVADTRKDVSITFDPSQPGSTLINAIDSTLGLVAGERRWRVSRTNEVIDSTRSIGELTLLHGDEIYSADSDRGNRYLGRVGTSGPERIELSSGKVLVGRAPGPTGVTIPDPTVSKEHATFRVTSGGFITVENLSTTNGTFVNGRRIESVQALEAGDTVELGDTTTYVVVDDRLSAAHGPHLHAVGGRLQFNRPPRSIRVVPDRALRIEAAPDPIKSRRFPVPLVVLPVLVGAAMLLLTHNVASVAFAALGPVMGTWNWFDDRRSGRGQYRQMAAVYLDTVQKAVADGERVQAAVREWNEWAYPPTDVLVQRARRLSEELWDRQPVHADFLEVRVGTADRMVPGRVAISERGDRDLVEQARSQLAPAAIDANAPLIVNLTKDSVLGVVGAVADQRLAAARSLVVQLTARHSPNDLTLAIVGSSNWAWATWLPHVTARGHHLPLVATDATSHDRVLEWIEATIESRRVAAAHGDSTTSTPIVVVIETPVGIAPARLKALITGRAAGVVSVVWLAERRETLPADAGVILNTDTPGFLSRIVGDQQTELTAIDSLDEATAAATARAMAPLVDPGTGSGTAIPERVGLFDVLGTEVLDESVLIARWSTPPPADMAARVGMGANGVVSIRLGEDADGPHGLVAGSTGSGKSEFLQTLVLSLAATYSPTELNLLFVDFKGGLTFRDLIDLPHSVGMVRNLDGALALRASRSLQAETKRRQRILSEFGAVNLAELRKRSPEHALPALVIIVDEYAELAQNLPEFLDSLVQVAQTGRALGLHLLLATQSPGNSVSKNIQNCAKYRVSFRLEDSGESMAVLGRGRDAAKLPNHPGRGLFKDGNGQLHEFQAAWAGGRTAMDESSEARAVTLYAPRTSVATGATDMERVILAIKLAAQRAGLPAPRRPWVEPLPQELSMAQLQQMGPAPDDQVAATIGLADLPDDQAQVPYIWEPASVPNLLLVGEGATGKSSALRSIASSLSEQMPSERLQVLALDATGGGMASLAHLPNTVGVVNVADTARLRQVLSLLRGMVATRRQIVGAAGSLRTYRQGGGEESVPDLVVLVDGLFPLMSTLESLDTGQEYSTFMQLISDGPAMGIHFAMTTDQPQRVPMSVANAVPERLALRMASRDAANASGIQGVDLSGLPVGRAISSRTRAEIQLAVLGAPPAYDGLTQSAVLKGQGERLRGQGRVDAPRLREMPSPVKPADVPSFDRFGAVALGISDVDLLPAVVDMGQTPSLIVMGPDLSGRSSVVEVVRATLASQADELRSVLLSGRGAAPLNASGWSSVGVDLASFTPMLEQIVSQLGTPHSPVLVALDDVDDLLEAPLGAPPEETQLHKRFSTSMEALVRSGRSEQVFIVLAGRLSALSRATGWVARVKQNQQGVVLSPPTLSTTVHDSVFNVSYPRRSDYVSRAGRGVLIRRGEVDVIDLVKP